MKALWYKKKYGPLERDVRKSIIAFLRGHKIYAYVQRNTGLKIRNKFGGEKWIKANKLGIPDIVGFFGKDWGEHAGKAVYVEVKRERNFKISPHQKMFIQTAREAGCFAMIAHSVLDVMEELKLWQG